MRYRLLGKTGLEVSAIGLGTAELGMDYGIKVEGEYKEPDRETSKKIIHRALDGGINLFDTAPGYGDSENLLGEVIGSKNGYIATKVSIVENNEFAGNSIRTSVEKSLKNLRRECLDIVQIHKMKAGVVVQDNVLKVLEDLRKKGLVRFTGVSVYSPQDAMTAIREDFFDVLQISYNIIDQRILDKVLSESRKNNIGVINRSVYFRGMLTEKVSYLNDDWSFFKTTVDEIKNKMSITTWKDLARMALRFCLATDGIGSVLVGVRTMNELEFALEVEKEGRLTDSVFEKLLTLKVDDEYWLNPLNWYLKL